MADPMTDREQESVMVRNMRSSWTPYQIEVLLHHYASSAPFPRADAPAYPGVLRDLRCAGLMATGSTKLTLHGGRFVVALCNTRIGAPDEIPAERNTDSCPTHPGVIIGDVLKAAGMSQVDAAERLRMSRPYLNDIIHGRSGLSSTAAARLGAFFGNGAAFWMAMQAAVDSWAACRIRVEGIEPLQSKVV